MSWEQRGNHKYYYAKRRVNGRVVSVYLGRGPAAQSAEQEAIRRDTERREFQRRKREWEQQDAWIENYCQQVELTIAAQLIAAGFHHHRGELRRTRTTAPSGAATKPDPATSGQACRSTANPSVSFVSCSDAQPASEDMGETRSAVDRIGSVLEGVEIRNPKYLKLLAKMKGTKCPEDTGNRPYSSAATQPERNVSAASIHAVKARLESAFAGLSSTNGCISKTRYSSAMSRWKAAAALAPKKVDTG
jgi:hypothetical protein